MAGPASSYFHWSGSGMRTPAAAELQPPCSCPVTPLRWNLCCVSCWDQGGCCPRGLSLLDAPVTPAIPDMSASLPPALEVVSAFGSSPPTPRLPPSLGCSLTWSARWGLTREDWPQWGGAGRMLPVCLPSDLTRQGVTRAAPHWSPQKGDRGVAEETLPRGHQLESQGQEGRYGLPP